MTFPIITRIAHFFKKLFCPKKCRCLCKCFGSCFKAEIEIDNNSPKTPRNVLPQPIPPTVIEINREHHSHHSHHSHHRRTSN